MLCVSEGSLKGVHSSFYDLFRVADGKIAEHWDTTEAVPPRSEWVNDNASFDHRPRARSAAARSVFT